MSAEQLNQLWNLVRENEKTCVALEQKYNSQSKEVEKLREDTAAMKAILNQALGAKTVFNVIGAGVVAMITWAITYFSGR